MAADRPVVRPPDTLKVRGRLRAAWLALWLAAAAGCVAVGLYRDTPEDTPGSHQIFLTLFLSWLQCRCGLRAGLDADGNGVVVRNMLRAISIPWRELATIEIKWMDSVTNSDMYYQPVFHRHDGSRVTAAAPGGGARPGEYVFELPGWKQDAASTSVPRAGRRGSAWRSPRAGCCSPVRLTPLSRALGRLPGALAIPGRHTHDSAP